MTTDLHTVQYLHNDWTLRALSGPVPAHIAGQAIEATIPGTVHTDLMAQGLIPDPYLDGNEKLLTWIGQSGWEYTTNFAWSPDGHERHDLVFEGLDTVARVLLNGTEIATTRNQHRTYRIPVDRILQQGLNVLTVEFASPIKYANAESLNLGYRPHVNFHPYNAIRKSACNFGWDWGLDATTSGIWRPVSLHSWSGARLASVRPTPTVEGTHGQVAVVVEIERASQGPVEVTGSIPQAGAVESITLGEDETDCTINLDVEDVDRWWPRGFGEQPLYDLGVDLGIKGSRVAGWESRVGFRTVTVELEPDNEGTSFRFIVNGTPVWARGANWIPDDAFLPRVDRARLAARLDQAEFANINLLRIWGGGIFESDDFFELCDERGIMTWQDFLFACASYAEEEPLRSEVEAEVRDNIERLMPHASLVLWNGNNENIWGFDEWGWKKRLEGKTWGLGYYLDLLPRLVSELDPSCNYTPGSPWSGSPEIFANDIEHGSVHLWEHWNRQDYPTYRDVVPRFAAEFGWQGPPSWSTMTRAISDNPLTPESPGMLVHQKAADGNDKLTDGLVAHLPLPNNTEDWHWAMSLNQANAMTFAIEHMRSWSPRCMGTVIWQLNDCWPVTSWAAVDGDGVAKPLLYALRHVYADRMLTIQPREDQLAVAVINDAPEPWHGTLTARRFRFDGTEIASVELDLTTVSARSSQLIELPTEVAVTGDAADEVLVVEYGNERATWFYAEYRDSNLETARFTSEATATDTGYSVTITAENLIRDLTLLVDKADRHAVVSDMMVTLLPRESVTFQITSAAGIAPESFVTEDVLRTANQLVIDWGTRALPEQCELTPAP
jgi:beta-mannosidase